MRRASIGRTPRLGIRTDMGTATTYSTSSYGDQTMPTSASGPHPNSGVLSTTRERRLREMAEFSYCSECRYSNDLLPSLRGTSCTRRARVDSHFVDAESLGSTPPGRCPEFEQFHPEEGSKAHLECQLLRGLASLHAQGIPPFANGQYKLVVNPNFGRLDELREIGCEGWWISLEENASLHTFGLVGSKTGLDMPRGLGR